MSRAVVKKCKHCSAEFCSYIARNRMYCSRKCSDQNIHRNKTLEERFNEKFIKLNNGCWQWMASKDARGYGMFHFKRKQNKTTHIKRAHIVSWLLSNRLLPAEHELDHLCRNHSCVNPDHLEAVTHKVNMSRGIHALKTHCPYGHLYSANNTLVSNGRRNCRMCRKIRTAK